MPHPVVIIGAGPIGLAGAAHAQSRGLDTIVLEAGASAGAAVQEWGHVRLFSPWAELVDPVAAQLLTGSGWVAPVETAYPTGDDWVVSYLQPLADALEKTDEVEVRYDHRVVGVTRFGRDRLVDSGRAEEPLALQVDTGRSIERITASAVVDASGTWRGPNPLGGDGLPALGESAHADRISYRVPDLRSEPGRNRYAGRHVVVAGTGASAQNALVEFAHLAESAPGTRVTWLVRRATVGNAFGGGDDDQLEARGALGKSAERAAGSGTVTAVTSFRAASVEQQPDGRLTVTDFGGQTVTDVDEIVAVTGFRPDLGFLSEIRLDLDPVLQSPRTLAPLIDPNVHSCGTVYPHGAKELVQPEPGFYLVGMKSYGRAPSFLTLTGGEQVRSVIAAVAGDHEAAERVELVLPDTGVCGGSGSFDDAGEGGGCCAPAAAELVSIGGINARWVSPAMRLVAGESA
jgi:NADPH-dependent 2,4-dienoyl-CoA reductase/sulfur reductase-like enzyme